MVQSETLFQTETSEIAPAARDRGNLASQVGFTRCGACSLISSASATFWSRKFALAFALRRAACRFDLLMDSVLTANPDTSCSRSRLSHAEQLRSHGKAFD